MKIITILLIAFGLVVAILPQFYTCQAHGFTMEMPGGMRTPMVCLWTAHAEAAIGTLLVAVGILLVFLRSRETRIALSILAIIIGFAILIFPMGTAMKPALLWSIGTCVNPDMPCVVVMKPFLFLLGPIVMATGVGGLLINVIRVKPTA